MNLKRGNFWNGFHMNIEGGGMPRQQIKLAGEADSFSGFGKDYRGTPVAGSNRWMHTGEV